VGFNLNDYEEVKDRIPLFWAKHPDGSIVTDLVEHDADHYIVKATLVSGEGRTIATGLAGEVVGSTNVNKTSALENCETSAIGRALANGMFSGSKQRPSREEMAKAERGPAAPSRPQSGNRPATDKQRKFLEKLVQDNFIPKDCPWPLPDDLSMRDASRWIDELNAEPKEPKAERVASMLGAEIEDDERPF
jgi:hypothetical protein